MKIKLNSNFINSLAVFLWKEIINTKHCVGRSSNFGVYSEAGASTYVITKKLEIYQPNKYSYSFSD